MPNWTLAELAAAAGTSKSVLTERFVRFLGEPPLKYLARWRLQLAARKLQTTQQTIIMVRRRMRKILWTQGILRHADADIIEAGLRDWRAVLTVMGEGPFFFGGEPSGIDAIVFAALATTPLTPIASPIRDFLRSQPQCVAYAERRRGRFVAELAGAPERLAAV
jgi:AraC-like DNA-binding protein